MSPRPIRLTRTRVRRTDEPMARDPRFEELDRLIAQEREREELQRARERRHSREHSREHSPEQSREAGA